MSRREGREGAKQFSGARKHSMCVYVWGCVFVWGCVCVSLCISVYVCTCVCMSECVWFVCLCFVCVHASVCVWVCVCVCTLLHVWMLDGGQRSVLVLTLPPCLRHVRYCVSQPAGADLLESLLSLFPTCACCPAFTRVLMIQTQDIGLNALLTVPTPQSM